MLFNGDGKRRLGSIPKKYALQPRAAIQAVQIHLIS